MIHGLKQKRISAFKFLFFFILCILCVPNVTTGKEYSPGFDGAFTFYWENDVFNNTDRYYTNGVKLLWISDDLRDYSEDKRVPAWGIDRIKRLPFINEGDSFKNISLSLGQNIYTPRDIGRTDLIEDDRPYAGYTYLGIALHSRTKNSMDTLEFDLGIVGPDSYAREIQEEVHNIVDSQKPRGWDQQLRNEPVLNIIYEKKLRLFEAGIGKTPEFDIISHLGGVLGNAYTYLNCGAEVRLGINLPADFGTGLIRPAGDSSIPSVNKGKSAYGFHLFAAVDSRVVFRNIFLDGNTFTESHEVDKKTVVADIMTGLSIHYRSFKITYSHVYKTREFKRQKDAQIYSSISITYIY